LFGAGFSGTLLALHLLRRCPAGSKITLIERGVQFGRGAAYSTGNASHLLNVPAGKMSAFHDRPRDFVEWLQTQADLQVAGPVTEGSFVPRQVFGNYVRHLLNQEIKAPAHSIELELLRGDARQLEHDGDQVVLHLDRRCTLRADIAVLAVGNFLPESPALANSGFYYTNLYRADPWAPDTFTDLDPASPVLMIGTGLTMVDAVISLLDQGHRGPIHALSRRGLCRDTGSVGDCVQLLDRGVTALLACGRGRNDGVPNGALACVRAQSTRIRLHLFHIRRRGLRQFEPRGAGAALQFDVACADLLDLPPGNDVPLHDLALAGLTVFLDHRAGIVAGDRGAGQTGGDFALISYAFGFGDCWNRPEQAGTYNPDQRPPDFRNVTVDTHL
jgi:hypothetical protein